MAIRLMGTLTPGKVDKRWFRIDLQFDGRRVRLSTKTRDRERAERLEQAVFDALRDEPEVSMSALQGLLRGRPIASAEARGAHAWTFAEAANECLSNRERWKGRAGWATLTTSTYHSNVSTLLRYISGSRQVASVGKKELDLATHRMRCGHDGHRPLQESTINRLVFCLQSILAYAKHRGEYPGELPEHYFVKEDNARQFILTWRQERELMANLRGRDLESGLGSATPRRHIAEDYADLFLFLVDVGCRIGAALRVAWRDVVEVPSGMAVRFWGREGQKGSRERVTPLTARAAEMLAARRQMSTSSAGPFDGLSRRRAGRHWSKAKAECSFANEPDAVVHSLRHTCATRLYELTHDIKLVQEWLGHACLATTEGTYVKTAIGVKLRGVNALNSAAEAAAQSYGRPPIAAMTSTGHE